MAKIHFTEPNEGKRRTLWKLLLPAPFTYESEDLLINLAFSFELTGGGISKILKQACIKAVSIDTTIITFEMMKPYILDEFRDIRKPYNGLKIRPRY